MPLREPYVGDDFYCDFALRAPELLDVVFEDDRVLAFHHTRPSWPTHVVVVPKRHVASLTAVGAPDEADVRALLAAVQQVAARIEREHGAARVLTNLGRYQDSKHLHVHVAAGDPLRHCAT
ncbi:MAG: HIT domain-containing protein [Nocardioides sp.]